MLNYCNDARRLANRPNMPSFDMEDDDELELRVERELKDLVQQASNLHPLLSDSSVDRMVLRVTAVLENLWRLGLARPEDFKSCIAQPELELQMFLFAAALRHKIEDAWIKQHLRCPLPFGPDTGLTEDARFSVRCLCTCLCRANGYRVP